MADVQVDVSVDMGDLLKKLRKLPSKVRDKVVVGAVRASAKPIIKEARALAPKRTGNLAKSIGANKRRSKGTIVHFSVSPRKGGKYDGWYAHFVEFGTRKMAPRPFLRPAFENKGEEAINAAKEYMRKRIDKELAKL